MKLLSLKCPRCRADLEGDNNSWIFFCRSCRIGVDLSRGREQEFDFECAAPVIQRLETPRYFAFWLFRARYQALAEKKQNPDEIDGRFWVPAFFIKNISYFGDIGLYYTNRNVVPSTERCRKLAFFPADRGEAHTAIYPEIYAVKKEAARRRRVTGITIHSTRLVWVPFYEAEKEFIDSILGWSYPIGAMI
ncbi:MAG TPA: hypothetical protein ENN40_02430 [Candidatus Aminicenantes bacterium]|nr:hypothetical protein [Candidatus Aminicenantes bacterium]